MWWALLVPLLGVAPERTQFVFELAGAPVGVVELELDLASGRYTYASRHLFTRGLDQRELRRRVELAVDSSSRIRGTDEVPVSLWLWRRPSQGCLSGREELGGKTGPICVQTSKGSRVEGTALGQPFEAHYGDDGRLRRLSLGSARFRWVPSGTAVPPPPDLFAAGFEVHGGNGALFLEPPLPSSVELTSARHRSGGAQSTQSGPSEILGSARRRSGWSASQARALARQVYRSFSEKRPGPADLAEEKFPGATEGSCLAHALRFVRWARARGREAEVVYGLVREGSRTYPHAWVRAALTGSGTLQLDPSSLEEVSPTTHLALGSGEAAGAAYVDLLSGQRRVVRR